MTSKRVNEIVLTAKKIDQQAAAAQIAEWTTQIQGLVASCEQLANENGIPFSLQAINLYTEDEARDNWESSSC